MEGLFIQVCNRGIAAGWLILMVLILRAVIKNMPKYIRCIFWGFVGFRLTCPWLIETVLSLIPSAETIRPDIVYQKQPEIHSGISALNQAVNPMLSKSFAPQDVASVNPLQIWIFLLSVLWMAGSLSMLAYAIVSYWKLNRRVQESVQWKENLYLCDRIDTPFLLGVIRPRIFLPSYMEGWQRAYVIAHEKAHLARHDHLWKLMGYMILAAYWFHPLCWVAYGAFCWDLELACDERVIRGYDLGSRRAYAQALLECSARPARATVHPLAFGEANVKKRIENVLNDKRPAFWTIVVSVLCCVFIATCFLTNPRSETEVFGHSYLVEETLYGAPQYSYLLVAGTEPAYEITKEGELIETEGQSPQTAMAFGPWGVRGTAVLTELTDENFDQYIENQIGVNIIEDLCALLRTENERAWQVASGEEGDQVFYYILQQKNGDVYLTYGYDRGIGSNKDDSNIRWIFKLRVIA